MVGCKILSAIFIEKNQEKFNYFKIKSRYAGIP